MFPPSKYVLLPKTLRKQFHHTPLLASRELRFPLVLRSAHETEDVRIRPGFVDHRLFVRAPTGNVRFQDDRIDQILVGLPRPGMCLGAAEGAALHVEQDLIHML